MCLCEGYFFGTFTHSTLYIYWDSSFSWGQFHNKMVHVVQYSECTNVLQCGHKLFTVADVLEVPQKCKRPFIFKLCRTKRIWYKYTCSTLHISEGDQFKVALYNNLSLRMLTTMQLMILSPVLSLSV